MSLNLVTINLNIGESILWLCNLINFKDIGICSGGKGEEGMIMDRGCVQTSVAVATQEGSYIDWKG